MVPCATMASVKKVNIMNNGFKTGLGIACLLVAASVFASAAAHPNMYLNQGDIDGIRAKVQAPGDKAADFIVQGPADHGVAGLVNLFGIESPGLTASPAIAARVCEMLLARR